MAIAESREVHLVQRPDGIPKDTDFEIVETGVADPAEGEVRVRNIYMSVDPAMRPPLNTEAVKLGTTLGGRALGRVEETHNPAFSEGDLVLSRLGWRERFLSGGRGLEKLEPRNVPMTAYLSVLGGTGLTAWGGMLRIGRIAEGETVFVSGAAGAVGSAAAQIAKIKGCRVIGSAGSAEKVDWLVGEAGLDHAFNYKEANIRKELDDFAPEGLDVYFENVGGDHLEAALPRMREYGRIPLCGMIAAYNTPGARSSGITTLANMIYAKVTMRGFVATEFLDEQDAFMRDMSGWVAGGRLKYRETILEGIENAPKALAGLFTGLNLGKMLVRLAPEN